MQTEAFEQKRAAHGFEDEASYRLAKRTNADIERLDQEIRNFDEQKRTIAAQTHELEDKLSGRQRTDLTALQNRRAAALDRQASGRRTRRFRKSAESGRSFRSCIPAARASRRATRAPS